MKRFYPLVPNVAFHKIVRQYALWKGRAPFTLEQMDAALFNYINHAKNLN